MSTPSAFSPVGNFGAGSTIFAQLYNVSKSGGVDGTGEIVLGTWTISAGTLGLLGGIEWTLDMLTGRNVAGSSTGTFRLKLGGTTIETIVQNTGTPLANTLGREVGRLINQNSLGSQAGFKYFTSWTTSNQTTISGTDTNITQTIDTSGTITLQLTLQMSDANTFSRVVYFNAGYVFSR